jgi:putative cell wall-binding protein
MIVFTHVRSPGGAFVRLSVLVALVSALVPGLAVAAGAVAPAAVGDVAGTVRDADTTDPIQGAVVTGYYMNWAPWLGGPRVIGMAVTGADGTFSFDDVEDFDADENFWIDAYADGYGNARVDFARPDTDPVQVDVDLVPGELALQGTVTDVITGDPIEGASVGVRWSIGDEPDTEWWSRLTDATGEYGFYGLPADVEFEVWFGAEGYEWTNASVYRTWDGGDPVVLDWELMPLLPYFHVDADSDTLVGWRWTPDTELDVEITRGSDAPITHTANTDGEGFFMLWLENFDIEPGDTIVVSDQHEGIDKAHVVTALAIDSINTWQDTIRGTTGPGSEVVIEIWGDNGGRNRKIEADPSGDWVVNWAERGLNEWGESEPPYDIQTGDEGTAVERDADGDATRVLWTAAEADSVIPIEGETRFETAVKASQAAYPTGAEMVVIATGRNWPDALGGAALAGVLNGPILLVEPGGLPAVVAAEIDRLGAGSAIIVGGTAAVSANVESALEALLGGEANVDRVWGDDRYKTADAVALRVIGEAGEDFDGTAFVATGGNFPDALAAAPLAPAHGWPLFLAHPLSGLSANSKAAMADVKHALILGGEQVVSLATEGYLNGALGDVNVDRLSGIDRYETAVKVATFAVDEAGHIWDGVGITTGLDFPDALAGGVLQGKHGSGMLLTRSAALDPYAQAALVANKADIATVVYYGGSVAVSQAVRNAVAAALH